MLGINKRIHDEFNDAFLFGGMVCFEVTFRLQVEQGS